MHHASIRLAIAARDGYDGRMPIIARIVAIVVVASSGAAASQAPEFAQQYRQRLGGTLDELNRIIARFDADAASEGLDRDAAIGRYEGSADGFLARRGLSVREDVERLAYLRDHAARLESTPPTVRPLLIVGEGDRPVMRATLAAYEPAVPLTAAGATYGLSGLAAALLAWWSGLSGARGLARLRARHRGHEAEATSAELGRNDEATIDRSPLDRRSRRIEIVREGRRLNQMEEGTS